MRERVLEAIQQKVEGQEITAEAAPSRDQDHRPHGRAEGEPGQEGPAAPEKKPGKGANEEARKPRAAPREAEGRRARVSGTKVRILVGTSGWSYKEWKGSFYPAKLPAEEMLRFYAGRFPTVEVNNSFYRIPAERVLVTWAEQVPDSFRFVLKASRRVTHNNRLADADGSLDYFLRAVNPLGDRLGPTLFQLPPTFKKRR